MDERLFRLDGRAGLVVGAGSGIGRAIALAFGSVGAVVGCVDRSEETARATMQDILAAGGKAEAITCDVTNETEVNVAVARFVAACGPPRVLVNGAAADDPSGTILELTPAWWAKVLAVNLTGPYLMSSGRPAAYDCGRRRQHHPHCLPDGTGWCGGTAGLLRDQGRIDPACQGDGCRSRCARHSRQYALTWCGGDQTHGTTFRRYGDRPENFGSAAFVEKARSAG